jgi:hypothetical protein
MTLGSGARLGPYEIVAPVGAGGMGDVYRARDSRLGRDVAIKVLPESTAQSPDALERFEREARAVAALSHPGIVSIHEFGREGETVYVVMELLDGATLRERLDRGPLTVSKAIEHGIALAQALAAAHARGVVHRDLKPENLFVTSDGRITILDFGLARMDGGDPAGTEATRVATSPGMVVGTVGYLAPEQARGSVVDGRADVFALGVVLYEMLTARRPFTGESPADVLTATLTHDPPPPGSFGVPVPASLERVVLRCLQKDPAERFQSARDLAFALDALRPATGSAGEPRRVAGLSGRTMKAIAVAAAAALLLAIGALAGSRYAARESSQAPGLVRLEVPTGRVTGIAPVVSVSPDGRAVAFANLAPRAGERESVFVRSLDSAEVRRMSVNLNATGGLLWSPDGRELAALAPDRLFILAAADGAARRTIRLPGIPTGGDWSRDDSIVFAIRDHGFVRISPGSGEVARIGPEPAALGRVEAAQQLPDGRVLYWARQAESRGMVRLLDGMTSRDIVATSTPAEFVPPDALIFGGDGQLILQPVDRVTLEPRGKPHVLVRQLYQSVVGGLPSRTWDVAGGTLAYFPAVAESVRFEWLGRNGESIGPVGPPARYASFDLAPDRGRILTIRRDEGTDVRSLWLLDARTGVSTQLVGEQAGAMSDPIWSPDGRRMAYRLNRSVVVRPVFGGEAATLLDDLAYPEDWSADGRYLLAGMAPDGVYTLFVIDVTTRTRLAATPGQEVDEGRFSPDGRWIAYHSEVRGRPEVFVAPFPHTGERHQISSNGGVQPQWCAGGSRLIYLSPDGHVMAVDLAAGTGNASSPPRIMFEGRLDPSSSYDQIRVTPDCDRILLQRGTGDGGNRLQVVVNWRELMP